MALIKSVNRNENRVCGSFSSAYCKIANIRVEDSKISFEVRIFVDKDARNTMIENDRPMPMENQKYVAAKNYDLLTSQIPSPTDPNVPEAARLKHCLYIWLKQQSDFTTATDD